MAAFNRAVADAERRQRVLEAYPVGFSAAAEVPLPLPALGLVLFLLPSSPCASLAERTLRLLPPTNISCAHVVHAVTSSSTAHSSGGRWLHVERALIAPC